MFDEPMLSDDEENKLQADATNDYPTKTIVVDNNHYNPIPTVGNTPNVRSPVEQPVLPSELTTEALIRDPRLTQLRAQALQFKEPEEKMNGEKPGVWAAAWETSSNTIRSMQRALTDDGLVPDKLKWGQAPPNLEDVFANVPDRYKNEHDIVDYALAGTPEQIERVTQDKDRYYVSEDVLKENGWAGFGASVALGIVDPINAVIGARAVRAATLGKDIIRGAAVGAEAAVKTAAITETGRAVTDDNYDLKDAITTTAAASVLGGIIGGGLGGLGHALSGEATAPLVPKDVQDIHINNLKDIINDAPDRKIVIDDTEFVPPSKSSIEASGDEIAPGNTDVQGTVEQVPPSASNEAIPQHSAAFMADKVDPPLEVMEMGGTWDRMNPFSNDLSNDASIANISTGLSKAPGSAGIEALQSPALRAATSSNPVTARAVIGLTESPFILKSHTKGKAYRQSAETRIINRDADVTLKLGNIDQHYYDYVGIKGLAKDLKSAIKGRVDEKKSYAWTNERVAQALRRGDFDPDNPHVTAMAKDYRAQIFNPLFEEGKKWKIFEEWLPNNPQTAQSYLTRLYNKRQIVQDPEGFRAGLTKSLTSWTEQELLDLHGVKLNPADEAAVAQHVDEIANELQYGEVQSQFELDNIGLMRAKSQESVKMAKGRRTWIKDTDVEDYLINDARVIAEQYSKSMARAIEVKSALKDMGYDGVAPLLDDIWKAANKQAQGKDPKVRDRILKKAMREQELVSDVIASLKGKIVKPIKSDALRTGNDALRVLMNTTSLGNVVASSISDVGMPIFKHGFQGGLVNGYIKTLTHANLAGINKRNMQRFGVGIEHITNSILDALTNPDVLAGHVQDNTVQNILNIVNKSFFKFTLLPHWTDMGRQASAFAGHQRSYEWAKKFVERNGNIPQREITRFAQYGISKEELPKLFQQMEKYKVQQGGTTISDISKWDDKALAEKFGSALSQEARDTVLATGPGSVPMMMQKNRLAKDVFRFQTFVMAASEKIGVSALQRRDRFVAEGIIALVLAGALGNYYKSWLFNSPWEEVSTEKIISSGIRDSGLAGFIVGKAAAILAPYGREDAKEINRWKAIGGPTIGRAVDITRSLEQGFGEAQDWERAKRTSIRMIPYNNLWGIKELLGKAFSDEGYKKPRN